VLILALYLPSIRSGSFVTVYAYQNTIPTLSKITSCGAFPTGVPSKEVVV
jgi:hypothetical protein